MVLLKKNIAANFVGKFWGALMSVVFVPVYIKFLGIEAYGLVGFYTSLSVLFSLFDMVLSTTINREMAGLSALPNKEQEMLDTVRTFEVLYWFIGIIIGIIVIALSPYIANFWIKTKGLPVNIVQQSVIIMGLIIAIQWPTNLYVGALRGLQMQVPLNIITVSIATLRGIGAVLILRLVSPTIQAFFIWQILISAAGTLLNLKFLWGYLPKTKIKPNFHWGLIIQKWRFATEMTGIYLTGIILMQLDKIIISKTMPLEMLGYYSLAGVVASTLSYISGPIQTALFPRFTQLISSGDEVHLNSLYHKSCQLISVLILPVAFIIILFSSEIITLWTQDRLIANKISLLVSTLIIGTALSGLLNLPGTLQLASGWTKLALYTNVVSVIILGPMVYYMITKYGLIGAAFCWVILNSGYFFIGIPIMHTRLLKREKWRWYFIDIGIPLVSSLFITAIWRVFTPPNLSIHLVLLFLFFALSSTFTAAVLVTPYTRTWITSRVLRQWHNFLNKEKLKISTA